MMKAFNVLLSVLVVLGLFLLAFEGGLRLLGKGPPEQINRPDDQLGWVKRPDVEVRRRSSEFDVVLATNSLGLRDDPMDSPAKPVDTFRVLCLGDSFTLGYTVERADLFVDQLESWWRAEGRPLDVINAGTEGYSTDQEVAWFLEHGAAFEPDLVLLLPYENDIFWNGQLDYLGTPKPRFTAEGQLEHEHIEHRSSWLAGTAIGRLLRGSPRARMVAIGSGRSVVADFTPLLSTPPDALGDAPARTRGALRALRDACGAIGAGLVVAPIPSRSAIEPSYRREFARRALGGLPSQAWSPDRPVDFFLDQAAELQIPTLDPRAALRKAAQSGEALYYEKDFHLTPAGNRALASFIQGAFDERPELGLPAPVAEASTSLPALHSAPVEGWPLWPMVFLALWLLLGTGFAWTYRRDEAPFLGFLKVGALLAVIFTIVLGGGYLIGLLPPSWGSPLLLAFVGLVVGFIVYKLGRKTGTILELFGAFVGRGHWYLMPLVVVLLTIGSLLVVAASSPLVAPFIYTLF